MGIVFYETEAAGGFGEAVESHYQAFELAAFAEESVDLFFRGVEGEVADVEGGGVGEFFFEVGRGGAGGWVVVVWAAAFFVLFVHVN